nr:reverse transcriptase domain-containing protein [Nocardioides sp. TF02-7]
MAQGFSTSPLLSNLAFAATDVVISDFAKVEGVAYTRYVDDLTFSGAVDLVNDDFLAELDQRLGGLGWRVNSKKTRFMRRGKPQFVTGLYVGDSASPHIPRQMKRLLRREVYFASKFGVRSARRMSPTPIEPDRLHGWVHYAAHVDPVFGARLRAMWNEIPTRHPEQPSSREWDRILEEINFPTGW